MAELTALSSRNGRAIATFLNFYVSHGSATRFLRNGEKYYIYFIDNLWLFPTVKDFQNRLTVDKVIIKSSTARFFLRHSVQLYLTSQLSA